MPLKIYHTPKGVIAEREGNFYLLAVDWADLVNDDQARSRVEAQVAGTIKVSAAVVEELLPVIGPDQELWACGVTYYRSMKGRQEESKASGGADFYARVYEAERPECFFKSNPFRVAGHKGLVRIRKDSTWDVPEPELTLVVTSSGKIIGYTIGNDMSSRSIEGENPLYLPQAKTYDGCAALGPCVLLTDDGPIHPETMIHMEIRRAGETQFEAHISIDQMKRKPEELVSYVYRESSFPHGCLIMTGTGIVPGADFTLKSGDEIRILIDGIGELMNTVK